MAGISATRHPFPPYVADFACLELRLIIEVDGGQHNIACPSVRFGSGADILAELKGLRS